MRSHRRVDSFFDCHNDVTCKECTQMEMRKSCLAIATMSLPRLVPWGLAHASTPPGDVIELPNEGIEDGRSFEALDPVAQQYQVSHSEVGAIIDLATNRVYVSNSKGENLSISISDAVLTEAGLTRAEFEHVMTAPGHAFEVRYDSNANGQMDDWQLTGNGCLSAHCSPWKFNNFDALDGYDGLNFFDRFSTFGGPRTPPSPSERAAACDRVRELSEKGIIEAGVTGVSCAAAASVVGGVACAGGLIKMGFTAHRRNQNQKKCKCEEPR
ncbi:hypothetical protein [Marilutibacter spongiae]|uniref:Uncharacterized protein n=1 Tax=Marilutibacter spongiae TaxID=2025720 RepID=A0A7W3Y4L0_9GAMM|nr:hypothetical protein [Lysobacter spongiae]MBB1059563.1 hypothetical protein [Lysobacter spongiae]